MLFKSHKSIRWLLTAIVLFMMHTTASAQATRTWVSGVGDDVNPCSRTAPCKTWPGAISKTAAGGEIDALDPGGFGGVTITKAMTLWTDDSKDGGILVAGTNGITVNCATDPNCIVVIHGMNINGGPIGSNSLSGIKFLAGGALHVEKCHITQFTGGSPNGYGIWFAPSAASTSSNLYVSDSIVDSNGSGTNSGGIYVNPTGGAKAYAEVTNTHMENNHGFGIRADDNSFVTVSDSQINGNTANGVVVSSASVLADMYINHSVISGNALDPSAIGAGIATLGANAVVRIGNDVVSNNEIGLRPLVSSQIISYGNNQVFGNGTNGAPTSVSPQQ